MSIDKITNAPTPNEQIDKINELIDDTNTNSSNISTINNNINTINNTLSSKENTSNKVSSISNTTSTTLYPSNKAVVDYVNSKSGGLPVGTIITSLAPLQDDRFLLLDGGTVSSSQYQELATYVNNITYDDVKVVNPKALIADVSDYGAHNHSYSSSVSIRDVDGVKIMSGFSGMNCVSWGWSTSNVVEIGVGFSLTGLPIWDTAEICSFGRERGFLATVNTSGRLVFYCGNGGSSWSLSAWNPGYTITAGQPYFLSCTIDRPNKLLTVSLYNLYPTTGYKTLINTYTHSIVNNTNTYHTTICPSNSTEADNNNALINIYPEYMYTYPSGYNSSDTEFCQAMITLNSKEKLYKYYNEGKVYTLKNPFSAEYEWTTGYPSSSIFKPDGDTVGYYWNDGTNIHLPKLNNAFLRSVISNYGGYNNPGAPRIWGKPGASGSGSATNAFGAFYDTASQGGEAGGSGGTDDATWFEAGRCSNVYGRTENDIIPRSVNAYTYVIAKT